MGCAESKDQIPTSNRGLVFRVKVLQALKLRTSVEIQLGQSNATRLESTRDPYVQLSCTGTSSVQRTSTVIHDSESPTWNEEFFFCVDTETPELTLSVMDKEAIKGDIEVGRAVVNLHGLLPTAEPRTMWLPLIDKHKQSAVPVVSGELGITVVQCYRLAVRINAANVPVLDSMFFKGNAVQVRHGRQEKLSTKKTQFALKPQHTWVTEVQKTFYVPYGEPSQLQVTGWSYRIGGGTKTTALCRGWHNVFLRGSPRTLPGGPVAPFDLDLPLQAAMPGDENMAMSVNITLQETLGYTDVVPAPPVTDAVRAEFPPERPVTRFFDCCVLNATNILALQPTSEDPSLQDRLKEQMREARDSIGVYTRLEYMHDVLDTRHVKSQTTPEWNEVFTFYALPVVPVKGWEPTLPEFRLSVWDHGLHNHDCLGAGFTKLEDVEAGRHTARSFELERGGELNVVFRSHFDVVVRVIEAEVFTAKDPNGMSDTFVELGMGRSSFRTRIKYEDRVPMYRDEFRFSLSDSEATRPGAMTLRIGVYDMDVALFNTNGMATDIVGLHDLDISAALKTPRTPVPFTCAVGVGNVMDGRVKLEVVSEYLTSPRELVVHAARYGFVDPIAAATGQPPDASIRLFDVPPHTGDGHALRTPNDPPATWRDVTGLVQAVLLDNKLTIEPNGDDKYLRSTFWPDAPHATKPNHRRALAVRYSIGGAAPETVTLYDQPDPLESELLAIDIAAPPTDDDLLSLHGSVIDDAEARAEAAQAAAAAAEDEVQRLHEACEAAAAKLQETSASAEQHAALQLEIAKLQKNEEAARKDTAEARRRAMVAKAASAAAANQTASAARENAAAQANESERLQRLREEFEKEAKAAEVARAKRRAEDAEADKRRVAREAEQRELEASLAKMRQEAEGREQLLAEKKRLEEEMLAAQHKRHEIEESERQAKLLEERIGRLKKQEQESTRKAAEAQREAERRQREAAEKAVVAQKLAATRVTPSYWSADADAYHGLRKVELSSDATWRQRFQDLLDDTCRRNTLGAGRDQIIKSGKYDRLLFHRAWRMENAQLYSLYAAHRDSQIGTPKERAVAKTHQVASSKWMAEMGLRDKERNELLLWHGTKPDVVDLIATDGFDERLCKLSGLFGAGVYFADEVSKSDQYVTPTPPYDPKNGVYHILLVRVTMGNFQGITSGTKDARRAPAGCHSIIGQIDRNKYREFVTYDGWLAYPEFLIQYKRQYK